MDELENYLGIIVVTLTMENNGVPVLDLGGCSPLYAAAIMRQAADMLEDIVVKPTITNYGQTLAVDGFYATFEDEEEE